MTAPRYDEQGGQRSSSASWVPWVFSGVGVSVLGGGAWLAFPTEEVGPYGAMMWEPGARLFLIWWVPCLLVLDALLSYWRHWRWLGLGAEAPKAGGPEARFAWWLLAQLGSSALLAWGLYWLMSGGPVELIGLIISTLALGLYCASRSTRDRLKRSFGGPKLVADPEPGSSWFRIHVAWRKVFGFPGEHGPSLALIVMLLVMLMLTIVSLTRHDGPDQVQMFTDRFVDDDDAQDDGREVEPPEGEDLDAESTRPANAPPVEPDRYVVRPGDSFWKIAQAECGAGRRSGTEFIECWRSWISENRDELDDPSDPHMIQPGQEFDRPAE